MAQCGERTSCRDGSCLARGIDATEGLTRPAVRSDRRIDATGIDVTGIDTTKPTENSTRRWVQTQKSMPEPEVPVHAPAAHGTSASRHTAWQVGDGAPSAWTQIAPAVQLPALPPQG